MPERILRAVAVPSTLFWAPQLPALINMTLNAVGMIMAWGLFKTNPLYFIVSTVVGHLLIASQGVKEPHLSTVLQSWAVSNRRTRNLVKSKTNKYVP